MAHIIDRRLNGKHKSAVNRQRFLRRFKSQIKQAVADALTRRSITDIESGERIVIPAKDTKEPTFNHAPGGIREIVHAGNKEFSKNDRIPRPPVQNKGQGSQASNQGEGLDDFVFEISKDEFLDTFFEDLALPDLVKRQITKIPSISTVRAGYNLSGNPSNINIIRSFKWAYSRRLSMSAPLKVRLQEAETRLQEILALGSSHNDEAIQLQEKIAALKTKLQKIPFIDSVDIRYNNRIKQITPTTQAVMFCIMDVSGSMDKIKKDIAKRFFILLYLFLKRNYEKIDVVFIRHHTSAKEVNEQDFFYSRETGGTVVSSALQLMSKIIAERYNPNAWNIYGAQASDGDNWNADSPYCAEIISKVILPHVQYYAYVEILPRLHQSLWESYQEVKETQPHFSMQTISDYSDIYPVFHKLFARKMA